MLFVLPGNSPHTNLATEEWLLQRVNDLGPTLLLYVNAPCVVMGKHQHPLLECQPEFLATHSIPLLRRFTGGGTVFHDLGNLNFSFLMPKEAYDEKLHFRILQNALLEFGVQSEVDAHKSLWVNGHKFSGSAFARKLVGSVHHGTLLVESNLGLLARVLAPANANLQSKAPRSRRAPVVNLKEISDQISISKLALSLQTQFSLHFPECAKNNPATTLWSDNDLQDIELRHRSQDWVLGNPF